MSLVERESDSIVYEALSQLPRISKEKMYAENIGVEKKTGRKGIDRNGLAKITRLPRSTIYDALVRLIRKGLAKKFPEKRKVRGRPKEFFRLI